MERASAALLLPCQTPQYVPCCGKICLGWQHAVYTGS